MLREYLAKINWSKDSSELRFYFASQNILDGQEKMFYCLSISYCVINGKMACSVQTITTKCM